MIRKLFHAISYVVIVVLKPIKIYAYRTRFGLVRDVLLEVTTLADWLMIFLNIQNNAMLLHQKAYKGNFIFGKGVMVTDYETTAEEIAQPSLRGNHFMGVNIISSDSSVFAANSGSLNQSAPLRTWTRAALDEHVFTKKIRAHDAESVNAEIAEILDAWSRHPDMAKMFELRAAATQVFLKLFNDVTVSFEDADFATRQYILRFGEISFFGYYLPFVTGLLGSHRKIRKNAFFLLKEKYDLDLIVVDMTLFAAMFSVGTLLIRCVEDIRREGIDYKSLDAEQKRNFIFEVQRLWPTVTAVHRVVSKEERIRIGKRQLTLQPGDEVFYPFACSNRDPQHFDEPEKLRLDRPVQEYYKVLSWSKGPHACPGKDISILVTVAMLDKLSERYDLNSLKIFNPTF